MGKKPNAVPPARRAQLSPQASGDPVAASAAALSKGPQSSTEAIEQAKDAGDDIVTVNVPQPFRLTTDDRVETQYTTTTIKMPRTHAEHPYSVANGVKILD